MGLISHPVKLKNLVEQYNLKNFVESGTGSGDSMKVIVESGLFDNFHGIELDEGMYDDLVDRFPDTVNFYNGYSKDEMSNVINNLDDSPTLFWLDAHFPGSDYQGLAYDSEKDDTKRIPLEVELGIISENRDISKDVIIMDDLRVYKDGPYESGNVWKHRETAGAKNCDFIEDLIGKTHILIEHHRDQGYMIGYPIDSNEEYIRSTIVCEDEY